MTKNSKLFAWDFHGTLETGTEVGFAEILRKLARENNYKTTIGLAEVRKLFGISILDYLRHFFPKLTHDELYEYRNQIRDRQNRKHIEEYVKPAPYAHEVLRKIKAAGHKNIVVSTSSRPHIIRFLEIVDLVEYFDEIFGTDRHALDKEFDIVSEKTKVIKSFAKKNKVATKNIIVIGDREGEIEAGISLGAKTYQYIQLEIPHIVTRADFKIYDLREVLREI
ncbi:MAG TPA: HAD hydrolase-like protein [Patescibacteria group bacterium]|nr:HAD hydrolase-like protein [Patescibacteria group bacterium]